MALTRNFKDTVKDRAAKDPQFRHELLREAIELMLSGDTETGKTVLRDYINATVGFEHLGAMVDKSPKSLMRMFGPHGNPTADNLFAVLASLQKSEGVKFGVLTVQ